MTLRAALNRKWVIERKPLLAVALHPGVVSTNLAKVLLHPFLLSGDVVPRIPSALTIALLLLNEEPSRGEADIPVVAVSALGVTTFALGSGRCC